jgi:hypothetical protein
MTMKANKTCTNWLMTQSLCIGLLGYWSSSLITKRLTGLFGITKRSTGSCKILILTQFLNLVNS